MGFAIVVSLLGASTAHAAFPGQNGKITFWQGFDLYTVNPDGSGITTLTNNDVAPEAEPTWSADGERIAFSGLFAMSGNTTPASNDATFITSGLYPAWAPDGQRVAFSWSTNTQDPARDLWVANADGTGVRSLEMIDCVYHGRTAWSPDGTKIAFERALISGCDTDPSIGPRDIYVINVDGTGSTPLTGFDQRQDLHPNWSPDGTKIVFATNRDLAGGEEIYVMNADGSSPTRITNNSVADLSPVWSPDGTKIAFERQGQIRIMNANGTGDNVVTSGLMPDWQPLIAAPSPAASHDVPRFASPIRVALVPNFRQMISNSQCTARGGLNSTHGPPLAFASCNPPGFVPGTIAHMGPGSSSWATYGVIYGDTNAANGDQANVTLRASLNDIRTAGGADYPASLTLVTKLRITDRFNGGSQSDPATVADFDYSTPINCASTAGPEGANCNVDTSADAVTAGTIKENKATVLQVFRFRVNDSGTNGVRGDSDDRTFATQGIYIP